VAIKNSAQKGRFLLVGATNTLLDFGVLFLLRSLGLPVLSANSISTSVAFCFSFFANKKYTFKTTGSSLRRELILFVIVTLFGLWVLQALVIQGVTIALANTSLASAAVLLIAKLLATIVSLIWNYTLYSKVVFKKPKKDTP
jgi:putative flippase GtrA